MASEKEDSNKTIYGEMTYFLESRFSRGEKYSVLPSFLVHDEEWFCIKVLHFDYGSALEFYLLIETDRGERYFLHKIKFGYRKNEGIDSKRKKMKVLAEILDNIEIVKNIYKKSVFVDGLSATDGTVIYMKIDKDMEIILETSFGYVVSTSDIRKELRIKLNVNNPNLELSEMDYETFMSLDSLESIRKTVDKSGFHKQAEDK